MYSGNSQSTAGFSFAKRGKTKKAQQKVAAAGGEKQQIPSTKNKPSNKTLDKADEVEAAGGKQKEKTPAKAPSSTSTSTSASKPAVFRLPHNLDQDMHNIVAVDTNHKLVHEAKEPCLNSLNVAGNQTLCLISALGAGHMDSSGEL